MRHKKMTWLRQTKPQWEMMIWSLCLSPLDWCALFMLPDWGWSSSFPFRWFFFKAASGGMSMSPCWKGPIIGADPILSFCLALVKPFTHHIVRSYVYYGCGYTTKQSSYVDTWNIVSIYFCKISHDVGAADYKQFYGLRKLIIMHHYFCKTNCNI